MSNFDERAKNWDDDRRIKMAKVITDRMKKELEDKKYSNLLDFGSGTGLIGFNFEEQFENIIFLEPSGGMTEILQAKIDYSGSDHLSIINDIKNIDNKVDVIVSSMVLHHIEDINEILKNFLNILEVGGKVLITDLCQEEGDFHKNSIGIYHHGFDIEDLKKQFENAGFLNVVAEEFYKLNKNNKEYGLFILKAEKA